ncbi:MAG: hypothetical protein LBQ65_05425 [Tannerellaceae bacterium]|jgi:hypothetical protein|nr:hypothetical protein [Tannerellaceae bacterium]
MIPQVFLLQINYTYGKDNSFIVKIGILQVLFKSNYASKLAPEQKKIAPEQIKIAREQIKIAKELFFNSSFQDRHGFLVYLYNAKVAYRRFLSP